MWWISVALTLHRGRTPFENELRRYSAQCCTTVPDIVSYSGPGLILQCKDPYLQEWILQLHNTPHTHGYTMKVEQPRPRVKPEDIYALAHKNISEREALEHLNKGDKTTVTYTHRRSHNKTRVTAVNANATADPSTAEPADTSVDAMGHPKPPTKKTIDPGPGFGGPNIEKHVNKRMWTTILIGVSPTTPFGHVSLRFHAMTLIGALRVSPKVVSLRVVGAIRMAMVVRVAAARAIREEKERRTGADVGRSAQGGPLGKKKPSGTRMTLRWLSLHRES